MSADTLAGLLVGSIYLGGIFGFSFGWIIAKRPRSWAHLWEMIWLENR